MEFFQKGGGGSRPIHNFEAHFLCLKVMEFLVKIRGGGLNTKSIRMRHKWPPQDTHMTPYDPHMTPMTPIWPLYDPHMTSYDPNMTHIWPPYDPHMTPIWPPYDPHMTPIWTPYEGVIWIPYDSQVHMGVIWGSYVIWKNVPHRFRNFLK